MLLTFIPAGTHHRRNRCPIWRGSPCAELWRRGRNHFLTGSWEPLQGLFNLPKAPKPRVRRPEEIGHNTATASICSRRTVKRFRIRLRRIASRCRDIQRHAICLILDPFLPVDDLSSFSRQLRIAVDAVERAYQFVRHILVIADDVNTPEFREIIHDPVAWQVCRHSEARQPFFAGYRFVLERQ